jgi:hypothetical protein
MRRRACLALAVGLCVIVVVQVLAGAWLEWRHPELRDPEFTHKWHRLRCQRHAHPDRPLTLILGSSRIGVTLQPHLLPNSAGWFNFGLCGARPVLQHLALCRLLDAGVRPTRVVLEYWPPHLCAHEDDELDALDPGRLSWSDRTQCYRTWHRLDAHWLTSMVPVAAHKRALLAHHAPNWLAPTDRLEANWRTLDAHGWLRIDAYREPGFGGPAHLRHIRHLYAYAFTDWTLSREADTALRASCAIAQAHGAQVFLLRTPDAFAADYDAASQTAIANHLRTFDYPTINASAWFPATDFVDGVHLCHSASAAFTHRLASPLTPVVP